MEGSPTLPFGVVLPLAFSLWCYSCYSILLFHLLLPGRMAKLCWWVSRIAPCYYARVMARRLRGEMDGD